MYYLIYSPCVIMHLILLGCVFGAWFNAILCFYTIFQKPRSQTLHMVPDLGKQGPRPCFGHFCQISFLIILISADMSNVSIMHTIMFLNILKPYFMSFFHILVFHTVNVLVITHNGETCKDKVIKHLNIFVTIKCTIYDSMFMACSLLIYPALRSKVRLLGSFH